ERLDLGGIRLDVAPNLPLPPGVCPPDCQFELNRAWSYDGPGSEPPTPLDPEDRVAVRVELDDRVVVAEERQGAIALARLEGGGRAGGARRPRGGGRGAPGGDHAGAAGRGRPGAVDAAAGLALRAVSAGGSAAASLGGPAALGAGCGRARCARGRGRARGARWADAAVGHRDHADDRARGGPSGGDRG